MPDKPREANPDILDEEMKEKEESEANEVIMHLDLVNDDEWFI